MEEIRDWLMAVIVLSVVIAGARSLMPPGGVGQVGGFVCGLALLCTFLRPLCVVEGVSIVRWVEAYTLSVQSREEELEQGVDRSRKSVIEEFCGAYIVEQAAQLGLDCRAEVDCTMSGDGLWLPQAARLWGDFDDVRQSRLTQLLETELGIPQTAQTYYLT